MAKSKLLDNVDTTSVEGLDDFFASTVEISTVDSGQLDDPGWSLTEAASTLGVTERTVRRWIKQRQIKAWKVDGPRGPEWRIDRKSQLDKEDNTGTRLASTVDSIAESASLIELVKELQNKLTDVQEQLRGASYRNGYLESENKSYQNQVRLLPDLEAQASKAKDKEQELAKARMELERLKSSWWYKLSLWLRLGK